MHMYPIAEDYSETLYYPDPTIPLNTWQGTAGDFPTMSYANHWHSDFEFVYIVSGSMKENINGNVIDLKKGDLLFVNSRSMHFNYWTEPTECDFICLVIHPSLIAVHAAEEDSEKLFGSNAVPYMMISAEAPDNKRISEKYLSLHKTILSEKRSGYELMGKIYDMFSQLLTRSSETSPVQASEQRQIEILHRITGFIQKNYQNKLTLKEISEAGLVGRSKCGDIFKKYLGKTPIEYLTEYRILKAVELLRCSDMSITEISMQCGFGGASYFTERFVDLMGYTPTEYRKRGCEERDNERKWEYIPAWT